MMQGISIVITGGGLVLAVIGYANCQGHDDRWGAAAYLYAILFAAWLIRG